MGSRVRFCAFSTSSHFRSAHFLRLSPRLFSQYHFAEWNCRAGQNNVIIRTDGTLAYCYNDARVIKFVWKNLVTNRRKGGAQSFQD